MSNDLPVPVVVDPETAEWSVDGFPMLLIPRHYWVQIMAEVEARFPALPRLFDAGPESA